MGDEYSAAVQTGAGAHPASCTMRICSLSPGVKRPGGVALNTHRYLVPRLKKEYCYITASPLRLHSSLWVQFYFLSGNFDVAFDLYSENHRRFLIITISYLIPAPHLPDCTVQMLYCGWYEFWILAAYLLHSCTVDGFESGGERRVARAHFARIREHFLTGPSISHYITAFNYDFCASEDPPPTSC